MSIISNNLAEQIDLQTLNTSSISFFKCSIPSCSNVENLDSHINFYKLPDNHLIARMWFEKCKISNNQETLKICEKHFITTDFDIDFESGTKNLKRIAVPCQDIHGPPVILKDIPQLYPIITKQIIENTELKAKIDDLKSNIADLSAKLSSYEKKIFVKKGIIHKCKTKLPKFELNSGNKNLLSKVFSDSQINVLMGKQKVIWSDDDLAMAFSLRQLSSKECYLYLKETLNIPLPALSCVQRWAASKN